MNLNDLFKNSSIRNFTLKGNFKSTWLLLTSVRTLNFWNVTDMVTLVIFDILQMSTLILIAVSYERPAYKVRYCRQNQDSHCLLSEMMVGLNPKNVKILKQLVNWIPFVLPTLRPSLSRSAPSTLSGWYFGQK